MPVSGSARAARDASSADLAERDARGDPLPALGREHVEQPDERQDAQHGHRLLARRERREEPHGRERQIDEHHERQRAGEVPDGNAPAKVVAEGHGRRVEGELREQREEVHGNVGPGRRPRCEERDDDRRTRRCATTT